MLLSYNVCVSKGASTATLLDTAIVKALSKQGSWVIRCKVGVNAGTSLPD